MGTYSKPSLVLDTSFGAFNKGLQAGVDKAAATLQAEKKQEKLLLEKQLKAQEAQQKTDIKWKIKQSTALNNNLGKINAANINNVANLNTSYIRGNGDPVYGDDIIKTYVDFAKNLPEGLTEDEIKDKVDVAGLDYDTYLESTDEVGPDLSEQLTSYVTSQYGLIPNTPTTIDQTRLYDETQRNITTSMSGGVDLLGLLNIKREDLTSNVFDGAFNEDGTIVKPKKNRNNTILLFPSDPNYTLMSNAARDMALGTNKGRYSYGVIGNQAAVIVTGKDGVKQYITKDMLQASAKKTGSGFVTTTNSDNFEAYIKGVKNSFNVNFKGVSETFTQDIPGENSNDKDIRITTRVKNIVQSQVELRSACDDFVYNVGLGKKGKGQTNNISGQANWQMLGGPIEAKEGDNKLDINNNIIGQYTQAEIDNSIEWTGSPAQVEKASNLLYDLMADKYLPKTSTVSTNRKEVNNATGRVTEQRAVALLNDGIQFPASGSTVVNNIFGAPINASPTGDRSIGLNQILEKESKLNKNNFKGKVDILNIVGNGGIYITGKDLKTRGGADIVDQNGNPVASTITDASIYVSSGNQWVRKQNLEGQDAFIRFLVSRGGFGTRTEANRAMQIYKDELNTNTATTTTPSTPTTTTTATGPAVVLPSDRRLKKNIIKIGESKSGLNIYEFEYINKEGTYQGVMSDEIPKEAVLVDDNGYDSVDYSKLDVDFKIIK